MNALARRFHVAVCAVTLSLMTSPSVVQSSPTGSTFTLNHAIHPDVLSLPDYIADPVGPALANAVPLFTVDQQRCNYSDKTVCLNFGTTYLGTFGASGDGSLDIESKAEADSLLIATQELYPIKVVRSLFLDNTFKGGVTADSFFDALIAYNFPNTVYAHEFGHMCGLPSRTDCNDALMWENTSGAHDNLKVSEVTQISQKFRTCCVRTGTANCDATGVAWVEDATARSGTGSVSISFRTVWEVNTQAFEVVRFDPVTHGVLYSLGTPASNPDQNGKRYSIVDPNGTNGAVYQVVEHQQSGLGDLYHGPLVAETPTGSGGGDGIGYNADSLAAVVASYDDGLRDPGPSPCSNRHPIRGYPVFEILCPDSFASTLQSYASLWRSRGVNAEVISKTYADSCSGGYREWIQWAATRFTTSFLLVGDANDHVMWDDSTRWGNGWHWPGIYHLSNGQLIMETHTPAQPEKDLIPTFYNAVTDSPRVSWTAFTPYYATDLPYADTDGDSLPDVIVGRLPASSVADVTAYTAKLSTWLSTTNGSLGNTAAVLEYAVNHGDVPAWPTALSMGSLLSAFPPGISVTKAGYERFEDSTLGTVWIDSVRAVANAAASGGADVIAWNLNSSGSREYSGFWQIRNNKDVLPISTTNRPFVSVALSCGMNDFDVTEYRDSVVCNPYPCPPSSYQFLNPVGPIVEKLLLHPSRGAIAQVGPTRGSNVLANPIFGEEFLKQLYMPGASVGRAFLLAQRICIVRYPRYRDLFKSYVLLGDPRLGPNVVTGVADAAPAEGIKFSFPAPNPFNPSTRLRFFLGSAAGASITIFDVQGRLVRHLLRNAPHRAGWSEVRWDGSNDWGGNVSSGIYFARLSAKGTSSVQRLVLLR
jgi:hypothetical protein